MDRGMKLMFGMMTAAICLMAINMFGNNTSQAYAANVVDRGDEPTIVWFGAMGSQNGNTAIGSALRLWSDGRLEIRYLGSGTGPNGLYSCGAVAVDCPWVEIPAPSGGDVAACSADTNGDMQIDVEDLVAVIAGWGQDITCEPTYDCLSLSLPANFDL